MIEITTSANMRTSDDYVELIQLQAKQVFVNKVKADFWLNQPKTTFGGSTPLELAYTEAGYDE